MRKVTLFLIFVLLFFANAEAADFCPVNVQAVMIAKVLGFTREIGGKPKSEISLGVLNGGEILGMLEKIQEKSKEQFVVKKVSPEEISSVNVVYIDKDTPRAEVKKISQIAKTTKILTICGESQMLVDYDLTLSFHLIDGKPRMVISVPSAEEEGAKFAASLLKIADRK